MSAEKSILLINGPNLNLLGSREVSTYGTLTLNEIVQRIEKRAAGEGYLLHSFQSNSEGELVNIIQQHGPAHKYGIINPAAYTHTSIAIRDALLAVSLPVVEVHLSNVFSREPFRRHSYISDIALGVCSGFGPKGYEMALDYLVSLEDES